MLTVSFDINSILPICCTATQMVHRNIIYGAVQHGINYHFMELIIARPLKFTQSYPCIVDAQNHSNKGNEMLELNEMLTTEMNKGQWKKFRKEWIVGYTDSLVIECNMTKKDARFHAIHQFEEYIGQCGHEARDEKISHYRKMETV